MKVHMNQPYHLCMAEIGHGRKVLNEVDRLNQMRTKWTDLQLEIGTHDASSDMILCNVQGFLETLRRFEVGRTRI